MSENLTWTARVAETADRAYAGVVNVRGWWSATITGPTDHVGAEFSYWVPGTHFAKFRVSELVPGRRVSWLVLDSWLAFPDDEQEWTGTSVTFDIAEVDGGAEVRFTHVGLTAEQECYDVCRVAWGGYVMDSLRELITTGTGRPNSIENSDALERVRATLAA